MPLLSTKKLWDAHPYPDAPCDTTLFENQCAIRMSVALRGAGADLGSFAGARCYPNLKHAPRHVLRAQELANWLAGQKALVGTAAKYKKATHADFVGRQGIAFIQDGWGPTDHIDVWDGTALKGGSPDYFARGKAVWFWDLDP
jgi:hypothetical protein